MFVHFGYRYLYTDEIAVTDANVFEVMHAAMKFGLDDIEDICSRFISEKLNEKNVGLFTTQALQFNTKRYLKVCLDYFEDYTDKVLDSDDFLQIPHNVLTVFSEHIDSFCETKFFTSCYKWAKAECKRKNLAENQANLRMVLGDDVLEQFKFERTGMKEFLSTVVPTKLLKTKEVGHHIEKMVDNIRVG